jgi:hypothetical protein
MFAPALQTIQTGAYDRRPCSLAANAGSKTKYKQEVPAWS